MAQIDAEVAGRAVSPSHALPAADPSWELTRLRQQLEGFQKSHETHRLILESAGEGIFGIDAEGITTFANPAAEAMTGWTADEMVGKPQHLTIHHSYADGRPYRREDCPIYMALRDGLVHHSDSEVFWHRNGTCFPVVYTSTPILRDGHPVGAVVLFRDVSERKRTEEWEQRRNLVFLAIASQQGLDATLQMIADAAFSRDPDQAIAFLHSGEGCISLVAHAGLPEWLQYYLTRLPLGEVESACSRAATAGSELLLQRGSAPRRPFLCGELIGYDFDSCLALPLRSPTGVVVGVIAAFGKTADAFNSSRREFLESVHDVARLAVDNRQLRSELVRQSQHDQLTGLPNRMLLEDRLDQALMQSKRRGTHVGLCCVDIDRFTQINKSLGHSIGDLFLNHVAALLKKNAREIDTVARQGGDEFLLVFPDLESPKEAEEICQRLLGHLRQPVQFGDKTITPTASIGISLYPSCGTTREMLLQSADTAMHAAKLAGRNRTQLYDATLGAKVERTAMLQTALPLALDRNQFHLVYQPLYDKRQELVGFESLLRWSHPEMGFIGPDQFIPLAEDTGLIVPIGEWVLNEACLQAVEWNRGRAHPVRIFVNVSGVQVSQPGFNLTIASALETSGLDASLLELEITETWVVQDPKAAAIKLQKLRDLGIRIAMDDFGCGHSSLGALGDLPLDTIKIDRSFMQRVDGSAKGIATIRTIISLAVELGLETVIEGVETELQMKEMLATECSMLQGYFLGRPLSKEAADALLTRSLAA